MMTVTVRAIGYTKIYNAVEGVTPPGTSFRYWTIRDEHKTHFIHEDEVKLLDMKEVDGKRGDEDVPSV